jgi:hypothetical protein
MKLLSFFYSSLCLFMSLSIQAASNCRPDTVFYSQVSISSTDSLHSEKKITKNTAANTVKTMGIISGLWNILGIISAIGLKNTHSTLGNLQIGRMLGLGLVILLSGLLGISALIMGIGGLIQRKRSVKRSYHNESKVHDLRLEKRKYTFGIIMGIIGIGVFVVAVVGG